MCSLRQTPIHNVSSFLNGDPSVSGGCFPDVTGTPLIDSVFNKCIPHRGAGRGFAVIAALFALVIIGAVEYNGLIGPGRPSQKMLTTVSGTIHGGLILTAVLYIWGCIVL